MSPKEDIAEKPLAEKKLETRDKSRSEFNAEIKALNEKRGEYSDTPLNDQIKEIEQEIDHLDRRVERLETLLDKTTLPQKLQKLIGDIAVKAKEFLSIRTEGQIKRALSESEKVDRQERQLARYGRTYRESIHSQIAEMKDKIETLQSRGIEYNKYRSFVTMIETEVMKLRASQVHTLNTPQKPDIGSNFSRNTYQATGTGKTCFQSLRKGKQRLRQKCRKNINPSPKSRKGFKKHLARRRMRSNHLHPQRQKIPHRLKHRLLPRPKQTPQNL